MNAEALMKQIGIEKEHKGKIEEITKYMEEHRIQELFNVSQSLENTNRVEIKMMICYEYQLTILMIIGNLN